MIAYINVKIERNVEKTLKDVKMLAICLFNTLMAQCIHWSTICQTILFLLQQLLLLGGNLVMGKWFTQMFTLFTVKYCVTKNSLN